MQLDELAIGRKARITAIDWPRLAPEEGQRLRALGIDRGAEVTLAYRGIFAGRDPLAIEIGRMTVALRRAHARAMTVEAVAIERLPAGAGLAGRPLAHQQIAEPPLAEPPVVEPA